jgi:hypothetical protein
MIIEFAPLVFGTAALLAVFLFFSIPEHQKPPKAVSDCAGTKGYAVSGTFAMQNYSRITREPDRFERQRLRREHQAHADIEPN